MSIGLAEIAIICVILAIFLGIIAVGSAVIVILMRNSKMKSNQ